MSYDYNALVSKIASCRRQAAAAAEQGDSKEQQQQFLQQALETWETLSAACPMTPLLWIQYAHDASQFVKLVAMTTQDDKDDGDDDDAQARTTERQILELGLQEFPGSALLHLRYVTLVVDNDDNDASVDDKDQELAIQTALSQVGRGSHRKESAWIAALYRIEAEFYANNNNNNNKKADLNKVVESFVRRAQTPLGNNNDALLQEFQDFWSQHDNLDMEQQQQQQQDVILQRIEQGRRLESKVFRRFGKYEDDIDMAMQTEGIVFGQRRRDQVATTSDQDDDVVDWNSILKGSNDDQRYGMGLGGTETARAFVRYALAFQKQHHNHVRQQHEQQHDNDDNDDDEDYSAVLSIEATFPSLATAVYERGVAECPTVESLWLSYIRHVGESITRPQKHKKEEKDNKDIDETRQQQVAAQQLQSVLRRAVRNCPYSLALAQQQLTAILLLANEAKQAVVDPDSLLETAQTAIDNKFLTAMSSAGGPQNALELYLTVLQVVKRRILFLLSSQQSNITTTASSKGKSAVATIAYDDAEALDDDNNKSSKNKPSAAIYNTIQQQQLTQDVLEEVSDLVEDLQELYDEVDHRLVKQQQENNSGEYSSSWYSTEGRSLLCKERAQTEALLLRPLRAAAAAAAAADDESSALPPLPLPKDEALAYLEKAVRLRQPPHPDTYLAYIHRFLQVGAPAKTTTTTTHVQVARRLRQTRFLYQKAVHSVARPKKVSIPVAPTYVRDFETALANLCHEWLEFERVFGSERSLGRATKAVQKKMQKAGIQTSAPFASVAASSKVEEQSAEEAATTLKRRADLQNVERPAKKTKVDEQKGEVGVAIHKEADKGEFQEETAKAASKDSTQTSPQSVPCKPVVHKVRVGKIEYPAHPFTVRVSNLSLETDDMDLVDTFRSKCGAIVHARIVREKMHHGRGNKSRGWGLVQFEERDSVEKALALNDVLGLHEKVLLVERSHVPAASLVPPGMHRVKPKGEGKYSKRNVKRRERKMSEGSMDEGKHEESQTVDSNVSQGKKEDAPLIGKTKSGSGDLGILAFRPRGVAAGRSSHQKPRLTLDSESKTSRKHK